MLAWRLHNLDRLIQISFYWSFEKLPCWISLVVICENVIEYENTKFKFMFQGKIRSPSKQFKLDHQLNLALSDSSVL